jgi:hypothetical protein
MSAGELRLKGRPSGGRRHAVLCPRHVKKKRFKNGHPLKKPFIYFQRPEFKLAKP